MDATFGRRLLAVFIDWIAALVIAGPIQNTSGHHVGNKGWHLFIPLFIFFIQVWILTGLTGSSFGQRLLRLRVVDSRSGGAIGPARVLVRTLLICGVVPAILTREGRGYHDWACNSKVIRV
jgi:uncharacterized RDD family membrane protein YckC